MQVILLENIAKLGTFGETVQVRPGYGRNYLIPQGKALSATPVNLAHFTEQREALLKKQEERRLASLGRAELLERTILRTEVNASEDGKLYGSVTLRDVIAMLAERNITAQKHELELEEDHLRYIGEYTVKVTLEGEKIVEVPLEIVRASQQK